MLEASRDLLEREVAAGRCHGYALAAGRGEQSLQTIAGGTLGGAGTAAVTPRTRFDLEHLTETMVAVPLTLLALEKGMLSLTDPISFYLDVPAGKKAITWWHLLTHTSGMEPSFLLEGAAETPQGSLKAIFTRPLGAEVGKRAKHSGVGFVALGKALEGLYGMPLDQAAKKHLFEPLGMKHTGFLPAGEDIAHGPVDSVTGQPRIGEPHDANARFLHGVSASAGLFSSAEDCLRFLAMLSTGGKAYGKVFLTRESLRLAVTEHTRGMKEAYGLGFQLPSRANSFFGDLWPAGGFGQAAYTGASLAVDPDSGLTVALLMSRTHVAKESPELLRLRRLIHNQVYAAFLREQG
ncbi:MAG: serine hydrolase domain-containing protein [Candidatus Limiplasma sp.]|nr:serine hydrolase domain-containing protein [Candidatus Limiplasma sp.]